MATKERVVLLGIAVLLTFVLWRFYHYMGDRETGHDVYPVGADESGKCPDLRMWGFKWSVLLAMTVFNSILLAYVVAK